MPLLVEVPTVALGVLAIDGRIPLAVLAILNAKPRKGSGKGMRIRMKIHKLHKLRYSFSAEEEVRTR